jgi:hypothetical protein
MRISERWSNYRLQISDCRLGKLGAGRNLGNEESLPYKCCASELIVGQAFLVAGAYFKLISPSSTS